MPSSHAQRASPNTPAHTPRHAARTRGRQPHQDAATQARPGKTRAPQCACVRTRTLHKCTRTHTTHAHAAHAHTRHTRTQCTRCAHAHTHVHMHTPHTIHTNDVHMHMHTCTHTRRIRCTCRTHLCQDQTQTHFVGHAHPRSSGTQTGPLTGALARLTWLAAGPRATGVSWLAGHGGSTQGAGLGQARRPRGHQPPRSYGRVWLRQSYL